MFPSGPWRGYWEQAGYGRQAMQPLTLRFADGRIEGEGEDCIGPFAFSGHYDARGTVRLIKQYWPHLPGHRVLYLGQHDGEGTIFGEWSLGVPGRAMADEDFRGPFALSPEANRAVADAPILEL